MVNSWEKMEDGRMDGLQMVDGRWKIETSRKVLTIGGVFAVFAETIFIKERRIDKVGSRI